MKYFLFILLLFPLLIIAQENEELLDKEYWEKLAQAKNFYWEGKKKADSGDFIGAIAEYNKGIIIYPKYFYLCYERGKAKFDLEDFRGAISDYNQALDADYVYLEADSYFYRGLAKARIKDFRGAIEDYNKVIELDPEYDAAYFNRGLFKFEINDINGACLDLSKAGELGMGKAYEMIKKYCNY
jgi:tetratricopeptide (TPR) repeat protein